MKLFHKQEIDGIDHEFKSKENQFQGKIKYAENFITSLRSQIKKIEIMV